jgi:hypothetical protein
MDQGTAPATDVTGLVEVHLLGLDLEILGKASEHMDELLREFSYLSPATGNDSVPRRLLDLIAELRETYTPVTAGTQAVLDAALARGDQSIDLVFQVPPQVREACLHLGALLDEADEYCRAGDLLTLATPDQARALREWYLGQFVAQIDGEAPTPWPEAFPVATR